MQTPTLAFVPVRPRVVLVHGLFMGRHAMALLARRLRRQGFDVDCFAYNTVTGSLNAGTQKLHQELRRRPGPVALVGHSLGGLVSLQAAQFTDVSLTAVVLLGSPVQGAKAARILRSVTGGSRSVVGRALHDWADGRKRPAVAVPVYTLAGTRSTGLGRVVARFKEPNDGTVTVAETHYPGATACALPVSHTGMLFDAEVAKQVSAWLGA